MNINDFKFVNATFVFKFENYNIKKEGSFVDKFTEIFDADPIMLPIPDDAPKEVPRIILKTKDARFQIDVTKVQMLLKMNPVEANILSLDRGFSDLCEKVEFIDGVLKSEDDIEVKKYGMVASMMTEVAPVENMGRQLNGELFLGEEECESGIIIVKRTHQEISGKGQFLKNWQLDSNQFRVQGDIPILVFLMDMNNFSSAIDIELSEFIELWKNNYLDLVSKI